MAIIPLDEKGENPKYANPDGQYCGNKCFAKYQLPKYAHVFNTILTLTGAVVGNELAWITGSPEILNSSFCGHLF